METFIVRDHRTPGQPLQTIPLKLPGDRVAALQGLADRLKCSRGALGRALLLQALERLGLDLMCAQDASQTKPLLSR